MKIRKVTEGDRESFLLVYNSAYREIVEYSYPDNDYVRKYFGWLMNRDPEGMFVAEENDEPVGFISSDANSYQRKNVGHIHELVVSEKAQWKGVGMALLQQAIDYIKSRDKNLIDMAVGVTNYRAINFYKKAGFVEKERKGDWLWMNKKLD